MALDPEFAAMLQASPPASDQAPAAKRVPVTIDNDTGALDPEFQAMLKDVPASSKPAQASNPAPSAGSLKGGAAEVALQGASGLGTMIIGGLAGLGRLAVTGDADKAADTVRAVEGYTYQPRTAEGRALSNVATAPGRGLDWLADKAATGYQDYGTVDPRNGSVLKPGVEGPAMAAAIKTAIEAAPMAIGARAPYIRPNTVNIGLNVGDKVGAIAPGDAAAALRAAGARVGKTNVVQSATEPTLVARTRMPLSPDQANAVAANLKQDAIAQSGPEGGALYGPRASAWGPFNPSFFRTMSDGPGGFAPRPAPSVDPVLGAGAQMGLRFTPEQVEGSALSAGRIAQSLTGSAKLERGISKRNAPVVDAAVGRQATLPAGTVATPEALAAAKAPWNAVYAEAGRTGTVDLSGLDPTLRPFIAEARQQLRLPSSDLKALDADDLVTTVRQLRAQGFANRSAPRYMPSQQILGSNQIAAAKALDSALDAHIQQLASARPGNTALATLMPRLMEARQNLATIASAQQALRPGGHFFAGSLYKQLQGGTPLSGDMKTIAQNYGRADRSLQDVNKIRDSGPFGVLDLLAGGVGGITHWPLAAAILARPLVRGFLESDRYQRGLVPAARPALPPAPITPLASGLRRSSRAFPLVQPMLQQEPAAGQ